MLPNNYVERVPFHTKEGLDRYAEQGVPPGGFLYAVLTSNLMEAYRHADSENFDEMASIVGYVWNKLPSVCWGSPMIVSDWIIRKRWERNGSPMDFCEECTEEFPTYRLSTATQCCRVCDPSAFHWGNMMDKPKEEEDESKT